MAGRLEGKVALISGAARGQGRSHAVRLAQEGADIIAFDVCRQLPTVRLRDGDAGGPQGDREAGRGPRPADHRPRGRRPRRGRRAARSSRRASPSSAASTSSSANAGIATFAENAWSMEDDVWEETIAVNLTGVWKTLKAAIPADDRRGQRRVDHHHQLHRGHQGHGGHRALRLVQARCRRADAHAGHRARAALDPGQHRAPHRREHADGRQRLHGAVPRRRLRRVPT